MSLPSHLQEAIDQWAEVQGISSDEFIQQTIAEKLQHLQQSTPPTASKSVCDLPRLRRKQGVLILETDADPAIDINMWIEELREERIREQMGL